MPLDRYLLAKAFPGQPRLVLDFEAQSRKVDELATDLTGTVAATEDLAAATAVTLSPNAALANERVLAVGPGMQLEDGGPGGRVTVRLRYSLTLGGGYALQLNLAADTQLTCPTSGTLVTAEEPVFPRLAQAATDAAAAAAGVPVGGLYRNGNSVLVRLA